MIYEMLLLTAVWITAGFLFLAIHKDATSGSWRAAYQFYLFVVTGVYFVSFWRYGQTLPMKTWRIKLIDSNGNPPGLRVAVLRYLLATVGIAACLFGLVWAYFDQDRQFLHDRLLNLRLVDTNASQKESSALDPVDGEQREGKKKD